MILPCHLNSSYIFSLFTGYEYDIFEVISNLSAQGTKFGGISFKKLNSAEFMEFVFFQVCIGVCRTALAIPGNIIFFIFFKTK